MKILKRGMALLLILMLLGMMALCEETENTETEDLLLLTVNGTDVFASHVKEMAQTLFEYGYLTSEEDYATTLQYIVSTHVEEEQIRKLGLDQFTDEEIAAFSADAQAEYDALLNEWMAYYQTSENPTDEETEELKKSVMDYFTSMEYTVDALVEEYKYSAGFERLVNWLEENYEISVTEEEVQAYFKEGAEMDRQSFENDLESFEIYTTYYGVESWYIPEGFRGILQILLDVDEELLTDYMDKLAAYEAANSENEASDTTVTLADVENAKAQVLASRQDVIDEIYQRLENGEAFADLIPEYNTDPGMNDPVRLQEGYMVQPTSMMDDAFLEAVFSEKMQKPGDVSDPSVGMYGIYITYYLRDIPGGYVDLTDELYNEIEETMLNEKLAQLYDGLLLEWAKECEIEYQEENLLAFSDIRVEDGTFVLLEADPDIEEQE